MGGKPANWKPGGGTNLRLGADLSRPRETREERQAPGSGGRPDWASEPGVPLSGPRADSHFRGCDPGSAGLGADCAARGRRRREETPSPAPRPGLGSPAHTHAGFMAAGSALARHARGTLGLDGEGW